ncbi:TerB family tellurite resistance protein [Reinekea thalattae]|uniref:TerB family tellurite resistance protein n=1 Tax=Reinekea thalattae TaxID=2593301 RepID=A0A5C8Z954_9GAMM|nr:TerB family tellurite resistance protein [Reinekea thalattae]TXR53773.1 TerB family tellurite resistance protein [Reinekea thalattae]
MLDRILAFFENKSEPDQPLSVDECAAALLIEVMLADLDADQRERDCIANILVRRTGSPLVEVLQLIDTAYQQQQESHDLYQFTKVITDNWDEEQRFELIVDMWRVALADGDLDKYEDHRIRRVNELLHLYHSHFIKAKSAAQH